MAQTVRFATLEKFKAGELQLLVCSDVAARGLDIGGLSHVFNFDVPIHAEDYVHRIGRTGRAGLRGARLHHRRAGRPLRRRAIEKLTGHADPADDRRGAGPGRLGREATAASAGAAAAARRNRGSRPPRKAAEPARRPLKPRPAARCPPRQSALRRPLPGRAERASRRESPKRTRPAASHHGSDRPRRGCVPS